MTLLRRTLVLFLVIAGAGCAAIPATAPRIEHLPFPHDKAATALTNTVLAGRETFQRSSGAADAGDSLSLESGPGQLEWAIYMFSPAGPFTLTALDISLATSSANEVWMAIADFEAEQWDISGPWSDSQNLPLDNTKHVSTLGNVYVAAFTANGGEAQVDSVILSFEAPTWIVASPNPDGGTDDVGAWTSMAVVNGNPAITYADYTNGHLKYVRATDAEGSAWDAPVVLDDNAGSVSSLVVLGNGLPAVSYFHTAGIGLRFRRASDANGDDWESAQDLDSSGTLVGLHCSMRIVNGNPAISYADGGNGYLKYIRADDADGTNWITAPVILDAIVGAQVQPTSLAVINGIPAIAYGDDVNDDLKYVRAMDLNGAAWHPAQNLDSADQVGGGCSLAEVNGMPAISYTDWTNSALKFIRASDASGSMWDLPQVLPTGSGYHTSLKVINGLPTLSYLSGGVLAYIQSTDADGLTWEAPQTVDASSSNIGWYSSLVMVDGFPAISYYDLENGELRYARQE